uniref:t-SNARE coiled-coil homology domain-containing protein n=1 Tax=Aureoumbra lagunensis TaxID=44058 RepID=A0A7S3NI98_9STRA
MTNNDELTGLMDDTENVIEETHEIGQRTLFSLGQQRNQFMRARDKAQDVREAARATRTTLREIAHRRARKRAFLWTLISFLLFVIFVLSYEYVFLLC